MTLEHPAGTIPRMESMLPHGRSTRFVSSRGEYRAIPAKFKSCTIQTDAAHVSTHGPAVVIAALLCLDGPEESRSNQSRAV